MPLIALAVLFGTGYTANESRKARRSAERNQEKALLQQQADAEAMRTEMSRQTAEYAKQGASLEQQANVARQQFDTAQTQYKENKAAMETKAKEVQTAAEEERRKAAASEASALKARTRGGRRSLLSQERMDSELGLGMTTLGSGMMVQ
jgi:hypothetical protein